jgi:flagellar basal body-associated protein FliL
MMTVEIAIATYEPTLRGEQLIEKLTTFTPKMRSAINLVLAEQIHDAVNTVAKRKALEKRLLATIKPVIDGTNPERPSGITDLYFTKFVISNTR